MAKTEKEQAHSAEEKQEAISIETAKVIQGISLVFSGAVTMLEALHPHVSLEPSAILHLVTGNIEGLEARAAEKRAKEEQENAETKDAGRTGVEGAVPSSPAADSASVDDGASAEVVNAPENTTEAAGSEEAASTVTQDDITRIIVQKIKQNRSNNEKIGSILKSYDSMFIHRNRNSLHDQRHRQALRCIILLCDRETKRQL